MLQLLADASGQNIVVSDSVSGSVTLRLQNVPWDQALDIVLRTKGLDKRQEGNVIIVAPADELAAREKADLATKKDIQELEPLRYGVPAGQLRQGGGHRDAAQGHGSWRSWHGSRCSRRAVSVGRRSHQYAAVTGHRRKARRYAPPGDHTRHSGQAGPDRDTHRRRHQRLRARARYRFGVTATHQNGSNGLFETTGTASGVEPG